MFKAEFEHWNFLPPFRYIHFPGLTPKQRRLLTLDSELNQIDGNESDWKDYHHHPTSTTATATWQPFIPSMVPHFLLTVKALPPSTLCKLLYPVHIMGNNFPWKHSSAKSAIAEENPSRHQSSVGWSLCRSPSPATFPHPSVAGWKMAYPCACSLPHLTPGSL